MLLLVPLANVGVCLSTLHNLGQRSHLGKKPRRSLGQDHLRQDHQNTHLRVECLAAESKTKFEYVEKPGQGGSIGNQRSITAVLYHCLSSSQDS